MMKHFNIFVFGVVKHENVLYGNAVSDSQKEIKTKRELGTLSTSAFSKHHHTLSPSHLHDYNPQHARLLISEKIRERKRDSFL